MSGAFENSGHKYASIFQSRFFTGLYTNRNPLSDPGTPYLYRNYAPRYEGLIDGSNTEITNRLTLARRPGSSVYNSATFPTISSFYEFRQFSAGTETIAVMADTVANVYDATGPSTQTSIFAKTAGSGQTYFQSVGNTLYFANGIDQEKYYKSAGVFVTNLWGIAAGSGNSSTTIRAGLGTDIGSGGSPGSQVWTTPNNVTSTVNYALKSMGSLSTTNDLNATTFGFSIAPGSTIVGIQVTCEAYASVAGPTLDAALMKAGVAVTGPETVTLPTSSATQTFGGPSDLFGGSFTYNDVNNSGFGVQLQAHRNGSGTSDVRIRNVQITIFAVGGPSVAVSGSAGTFSATVGYKYVFAYGNSVTGHVSSASPASSSTGVFTNKLNVAVGLIASTDPQVDQIRVFRTTDGGSSFLELPTSPFVNSTGSILDNSSDASLAAQIKAPTLTSNNPPPVGLINLTYHLGRIWGSVNNTVYYSGGPDTLVGNGNEAFPPTNFFIFPSVVTRLFPCATGLFVFTLSDVYFIGGTTTNPANGVLLYSVPFLHGVGLRSYNALDVQGSIIYMLSTDGQFLSLDPNSGVSEIGAPIGDKLSAFDSSLAYIAVHNGGSQDKAAYIANGSTGWYRLNPTPAPESGFTWSPFATITGGVKAIQSVEVSPGVHRLLLGPTSSGPILQRDLTVSQDNGSNYAAFATIGSLVFAQPGSLALLDFVTTDSLAIGSHPTVAVLMDEISGSFTTLTNRVSDPTQLAPSVTTFGDRFYFAQVSTVTAACRHMQIKFSWPAENFANELLSFTIFGTHYNEKG